MVDYFSESKLINCITGDTDYLLWNLKNSLQQANIIDIMVAFLMESGVHLLLEDLKDAADRNCSIRILCGNYLNITQPQALYLLRDALGDKIDLRFYNNPTKSFHAKAYLFENISEKEIYIGSSNMSRSALTSGIEWNYRITDSTNKFDYHYFKDTFEDLFLNHSLIIDDDELKRYSKNWKKPKLFLDIEKFEDGSGEFSINKNGRVGETTDQYQSNETVIINYPRPIGAQIEALYELKKARADGWDKGLVVAATGVGKTFLAAFDSKEFNRILFIAHREEILMQAESTFHCVRPDLSTGYFSGNLKDTTSDILFATIQTLGKKEYLNDIYFKEYAFDYIVIDEFHHAAARSYKDIINYFQPKFMLGLTATPERMDNQDVFALCDYNLVYEIRLKEAINKGLLVPFRYYGIYDDTDYSSISNSNGKYDEKQLEQVLSINKRGKLILNHYLKYNSLSSLGFCSSRYHAVFMADYFNKHGVKACAVISGSEVPNDSIYVLDRQEAIRRLKNRELHVIFSVDIFNEGLDVPEIDMVLFLRPTESPTIFLQQLGRGLRRNHRKDYLNVLDFIGNYKKANLIPAILAGTQDYDAHVPKNHLRIHEEDYPLDCFIDFDFRLVDLFKKMAEEGLTLIDKIREEYFRIKSLVGERPMRLDVYTYLDEYVYLSMKRKRERNIFRDYLSYLDSIGELTVEESTLIGTIAHKFLIEIENTNMSKLYKMPVLYAFYNKSEIKLSIDDDDLYRSFVEFYSHGTNTVDLKKDHSTSNFREWGKKEYVSLARRNPVHFLQKSSPEFFYLKNNLVCLTDQLQTFVRNAAFLKHFKDILDFKARRFYKERLENKY